MLNLKHLYYFHIYAQELSTTQAAKRLGISAPALSNQLKELEGFLGFKLTTRIDGKAVTTEHGKMVMHYAERMFLAYEELKTRIPNEIDAPVLCFRVGICENIGARFSFDLLSLVAKSRITMAQNAEVAFRSAKQLVADFNAGQFDVIVGAFESESVARTKGVTQTLDFPVRLFAPASLFEGLPSDEVARLKNNLDDLIAHANSKQIAVIVPSEPALLRAETERFFLNLKAFPARTIVCNNSSGIVELIDRGYAMGFVPTPSLLDFKSSSVLNIIGPPGGYWNHGISVVGQNDLKGVMSRVSPLADIFLEKNT